MFMNSISTGIACLLLLSPALDASQHNESRRQPHPPTSPLERMDPRIMASLEEGGISAAVSEPGAPRRPAAIPRTVSFSIPHTSNRNLFNAFNARRPIQAPTSALTNALQQLQLTRPTPSPAHLAGHGAPRAPHLRALPDPEVLAWDPQTPFDREIDNAHGMGQQRLNAPVIAARQVQMRHASGSQNTH